MYFIDDLLGTLSKYKCSFDFELFQSITMNIIKQNIFFWLCV